MKKFLSLALSIIMLFSITAGMNFSAIAEESVKLIIGSNVTAADKNSNLTDKVKFGYTVKINGSNYNGTAIGKSGKKYTVSNGALTMPATESAYITVGVGAKYSITRKAFNQKGFEPIAQTEAKTGVAATKTYTETIMDSEGENVIEVRNITEAQYNKYTDNGEMEVVLFYYNDSNERKTMFEVEEFNGFELNAAGIISDVSNYYLSTESQRLTATWNITSTCTENKPITSIGKPTYTFSGAVKATIDGKVFSSTYDTGKMASVETTQKAAAAAVKLKIKSVLNDAITLLQENTNKKVYLESNIDEIAPAETAFQQTDKDKKIAYPNTTLWQFVPYVARVSEFKVAENGGEVDVIFDATLKHVHVYNDKVVAPSCTSRGYTSHTCSCGNSYNDSYTAKKEHNFSVKKVTKKATTKADGVITSYCKACNAAKEQTTVIPSIKSVTISKTSYVYDGNVKKPAVTVKDRNGNTISNTYYTVTYSNNKLVGKGSVKVTFKTRYSGTVTKTFTIAPKGTTLVSLTAKSKGFLVKWNKRTTQVTGYQIQYSTSSKFTNPKLVTVTSNSTVSKTITKLTAKKKYFVRVRTYKTVNGTKYYSAWSGYKYVTTKA